MKKLNLRNFFKNNPIWFWVGRIAVPVAIAVLLTILFAHGYTDSLSTATKPVVFSTYFKSNMAFMISYMVCAFMTCLFIVEVIFLGIEKLLTKIFG